MTGLNDPNYSESDSMSTRLFMVGYWFQILKATAQYWIEMAVRLTETPTIPYR